MVESDSFGGLYDAGQGVVVSSTALTVPCPRRRQPDMALHAACARRRLGELTGGDEGRTLIAAANEWMRGQEIKNPERMAAVIAPGKWS